MKVFLGTFYSTYSTITRSPVAAVWLILALFIIGQSASAQTGLSLEEIIQQQTAEAFAGVLPPSAEKSGTEDSSYGHESPSLTASKVLSPFVCLPTCSETDGRFLVMAHGTAFNSFSEPLLELRIAVPASATSFQIGIFDGDGTELDDTGESRWDLGFAAPFEFTLTADPQGNGSGTTVVNLDGAPSALSSAMPNNDWIDFTVPTGSEAMATNGIFFYRLHIELLDPSIITMNAFKVRTTGSIALENQAFSYIANFANMTDGFVLYPSLPDVGPTTYNGVFDFYFEVPAGQTEVTVWDGDFDRGKWDFTDQDTDDADTPGAPFVPAWAPFDAAYEGVAFGDFGTTGAPRDDMDPDASGGLGLFQLRSPSIRSDLLFPDGQVFANENPSGNQEWEQFRVATGTFDPATMDAATSSITGGVYHLRIDGVDLQNLNSLYLPYRVLCVDGLGDPCDPFPSPSPGTGTVGYWKNHAEDWPVDQITLGGITYTRDEAIEVLNEKRPGNGRFDKSFSLWQQLLAATLNVISGNDSSCVTSTLDAAHAWLVSYPLDSGLAAKDPAWTEEGEALSTTLDDYNNGLLCAPHRD